MVMTCPACKGLHRSHTRKEGCSLEGVELVPARNYDCAACRGRHVRHSWGPDCRLGEQDSAIQTLFAEAELAAKDVCWRQEGVAALLADLEVQQLVPRIYETHEVLQSQGQMRELFMAGAEKELDQLAKTGTLIPIDEGQAQQLRREGYSTIPAKIVWQLKVGERNLDGSPQVVMGKMRLTGAGNHMSEGEIDSFTKNADSLNLRTAALIAADQGWGMTALDVSTAFLSASLHNNERVIVRVPSILHRLGLVPATVTSWRVEKALYGLRSSPRSWGIERDTTLRGTADSGYSFQQVAGEESLWKVIHKDDSGRESIAGLLLIYVNDFLITGGDATRKKITEILSGRFSIGTVRSSS